MQTKMRFHPLRNSLSVGLILAIFYMVICCGVVDSTWTKTNDNNSKYSPRRILQYKNPKTVHRLQQSDYQFKINNNTSSMSTPACGFACSTLTTTTKTSSISTTTTTVEPLTKGQSQNTDNNTNRTLSIPSNNSKRKTFLRKKSKKDGLQEKEQKVPSLKQLTDQVGSSRKECKLKQSKSFHCQRIRWSWWLLRELEKNTTKLNDFVELVYQNGSDVIGHDLDASQLMPESGPEKFIYNLVKKWGEPMDELLFFKVKKYAKSRELKVSIPRLATEFKIGPKTHTSVETGRILFDPGFNFKMKIPFFRDEMKFAVSTGPSFLAGLGVGMVMLGLKSMFSPLMFAMKAMMFSYFMRDMNPFDVFRYLGFGGSNDEHVEADQNYDVYEAPQVHNPYDNVLDKHATGTSISTSNHINNNNNQNNNHNPGFTSYANNINIPNNNIHPTGSGGYDLGQNFNLQYGIPQQINPIINVSPGLTAPATSYHAISPASLMNIFGRRQKPITTGPSGPTSFSSGSNLETQSSSSYKTTEAPESGFKYVPSAALQLEVENFDPFYSPLLSRIDSIFMHLGFTEEGCKERAVCSIYKFPVKYAPYSNLLSAQLSKHQSELKRPVSTSPKILRYFKYMKAAKDGQAALNCLELYPKCTNDTEKLSNLPMVKTFQTLTELMGTGSG